jgi:lysophospholipase L1-like esterase
MSRRLSFFALLACLGCGPLVTAPVPDYVAYGDSITYGLRLASPTTQNYAYDFSVANKLALKDLAISGLQACDVPTQELFPYLPDAPTPPHLTSLLIGTNDVDIKGTGPYEAVFNLCQQATIGWLAVPASAKVRGNSALVTTSGPAHLDTSNGWNARVTDAVNASVTFPVLSAVAGPIYVWYRIADGNPGTFTYAVDGKVVGSASSSTTPAIATQGGITDSAGFLRIPSVTAGSHTITFTQTAGGASGAGIIAVGAPTAPVSSFPEVLVGTIPKQWMGTGGPPCTFSTAPCDQYTADITANVAIFVADGLNVRLFNTSKYMTGNSTDMSDSAHPNALGQQEIAHALQDVY